jgi:hypothetical protein
MKRFLLICLILTRQLLAAPPSRIPDNFYKDFTLNGQIEVLYEYIDGTVSQAKPNVYAKETIDQLLKEIQQHKTFYYGVTDTWLYQALEKYSIKDKKVAIFGSVKPIYESICLFFGGTPVTIEYNKWSTNHPALTCITPAEYEQNPILFDAAFSISSFEHDGLGRYGDPINPWADIETMQKTKKMLKPNGLLFLAVPVAKDYLVWNAHRIYGKIRLPLLLQGWEIVECFGIKGLNDPIFNPNSNRDAIQPVLVLKNTP